MKLQCPNSECMAKSPDPIRRPFVRKGSFFRRSDGQWIPRFHCRWCRRTFSSASWVACYRQKKRRLNSRVFELHCSGVSQRRMALLLRVNRKTVVRKIRFLAQQERELHEAWKIRLASTPLREVQFDDLRLLPGHPRNPKKPIVSTE